jgi:hypothetical protein
MASEDGSAEPRLGTLTVTRIEREADDSDRAFRSMRSIPRYPGRFSNLKTITEIKREATDVTKYNNRLKLIPSKLENQ